MTTLDEATKPLTLGGSATLEPMAIALSTDGTGYQPGACNIGPAEIARRRRGGHFGLGAAVALAAGLVVVDAPPVTRLLVAIPATIAASGYLQARLRFCTGFGSLGVFNFGPVGPKVKVEDPEALRLDRKRSTQISAASIGIGVIAGVLAAALPVTRR